MGVLCAYGRAMMNRIKELDLCLQDLKQVTACKRISSRFHKAATWLEGHERDYQRDEKVAKIVIGGPDGTISDALSWAEIQCISRQYHWFARQEQSLLDRVDILRAEIEVAGPDSSSIRGKLRNALNRQWPDSWLARNLAQDQRDEMQLINESRSVDRAAGSQSGDP